MAQVNPAARERSGFYVETWGGGRYTSVAWCLTREGAERARQDIIRSGRWQGMPPRVVLARGGGHAVEGGGR